MCAIPLFFISSHMIALVLAIPGNIFILLVNILDVINLKPLYLIDQLIGSITLVNIFHQLLYLFETRLCFLVSGSVSINAANICLLLLFITLASCKIWLSTWLCLHFCMKIVNVKQRFYMYLQQMFPRLFKWILGMTVLGSVLLSFQSVLVNVEANLNDSNMTLGYYKPYISSAVLYCTTLSLSFVIFITSALAIIASLCRHMKRMQDNANGSRSPNVEAHVRATKTVLSLLAINVLFFTSIIEWFLDNKVSGLYDYISFICLAVGHIVSPLILIKGNNKLEKALQDFLHGCSCTQNSDDRQS